MAIVAKAGATFAPCPAGSHIGICCDVVDLGLVKTVYGGKTKTQPKIRVVWQTGEYQESGKPFYVSKRYTLSLHEKAALRKDLETWRGRPFTNEELEGWDVEAVLGAAAMLAVTHNAVQGSVWANVQAVMKPPKGMPVPALDASYIRVKDRPKDGEPGHVDQGPDTGEWSASDEDVPF